MRKRLVVLFKTASFQFPTNVPLAYILAADPSKTAVKYTKSFVQLYEVVAVCWLFPWPIMLYLTGVPWTVSSNPYPTV